MPSLITNHSVKEYQLLALSLDTKWRLAELGQYTCISKNVTGKKKQEGKPFQQTTSRPTVSLGPLWQRKLLPCVQARATESWWERGKEGSEVLSELVEKGKGSFEAGSSLSFDSTYTHLLSWCFRNCRLRLDHPQEGKQALISALQGPALSPGLSPLHATYYTGLKTHKLPDYLTSLLSPKILSKKIAD